MASGQLQGQLQAQDEVRRQQQQDYSNALQQFQIGHSLEAEQRASQQDYLNKQLALAPQVEPGTPRADYISQIFKNLNANNAQPYNYGLEQFGQIAHGAPGAGRYPTPVYQPPPVLSIPATLSAQGGAPGPGTTPGAPPNPSAISGLLDAYQANPAQFAPPTTQEQAARAAQAQVPGLGTPGAAPGAAPGGASPASGGNYSVDAVMSQILGGPGGNPQGAPGVSPLGAPLPPPGTDPRTALLTQAGVNPDVVQRAQAVQQHAHSVAGVVGGGSGSNGAGTIPPPEHHPEITQPSGFGPSFGGQPMAGGAPPNFVPPSASLGTAPQVVNNQPMLRLPGFSQPIPFGAVKPEVIARYESDFQRALGLLNRSHLPDYLQTEVARVAAQRPYKVETPEELQQLVSVTEQLGVLAAGRSGSVYGAEQRASGQVDVQRDRDIKNVLAALGKSPRASDPAYVSDLVRTIGQGRIDDLIPSFATGQFGGVEARKELAHVMSEIAAPNFAHLPAEVQKQFFQSAIGLGKQFGETLTFPAKFVTQLTPKELRQLSQNDLKLSLQGDAVSVSVAREELARDTLNAKLEGLIGRSATGADGRHVLTPNGQLNAYGKQYDKATRTWDTLFRDKSYVPDRDRYLKAKQEATSSGTEEYVAIRNLTKDPHAKTRIIAEADLAKLHAQHAYQETLDRLTNEAQQQTTAPAPAAARAAGPIPNRGVPGAFQGNRVPAIVNGQRFVIDPTAMAARLLSSGRAKNAADAQRQVQGMVQAAKNGR